MTKDSIDVVVSFDTTGSMYTCLTQVRNKITELAARLFRDIPNLRMGILAHGDYCDGPRVISKLDLTSEEHQVTHFVRHVQATGGGDAPECYELALHEARSFSWSAGKNKALVLIGDDVPHGPHERQNTKKLDWRNELGLLLEAGVHVHAVQALGRSHATPFWQEVANTTGGCHLQLHQFSNVTDLLLAICYKQGAPAQFETFHQEVQKGGRMNRSMYEAFSTLNGVRTPTTAYKPSSDLEPVHPSRFQVLDVESDVPIAEYVRSNGLDFRVGRGFYEFTKSVKVQDHKEVILVDKRTGDMYSGSTARKLLKLPLAGTVTIKPEVAKEVLRSYSAFIQSTSPNRKLIGGTRFLYEVSDWSA